MVAHSQPHGWSYFPYFIRVLSQYLPWALSACSRHEIRRRNEATSYVKFPTPISEQRCVTNVNNKVNSVER